MSGVGNVVGIGGSLPEVNGVVGIGGSFEVGTRPTGAPGMHAEYQSSIYAHEEPAGHSVGPVQPMPPHCQSPASEW